MAPHEFICHHMMTPRPKVSKVVGGHPKIPVLSHLRSSDGNAMIVNTERQRSKIYSGTVRTLNDHRFAANGAALVIPW